MASIPVDTDEYRLVARVPPPHADCAALRPLENHLLGLARLLEDARPGTGGGAQWRRAAEWMRRAGGLQAVVIELRADEPYPYLCGHAADAVDADDALASQQATEHTRLLYANAALERLLAGLDLPENPAARGRVNAAVLLLTETAPEPLEHEQCVLRHLLDHLHREPGLREDDGLRKALKVWPWRAPAARLLSAPHALRNLPAHGDADLPVPDDEHRERQSRARDDLSVHPERLAVRALALGIQQLLVATGAAEPGTDASRVHLATTVEPWDDHEDGEEDEDDLTV